MPNVFLNGEKSAAEAARWAKRARLRYTNDGRPGILRVTCGGGFRYFGRDRKAIHDDRVRDRIRRLAIPPAWTDVWICPDASGHLQLPVAIKEAENSSVIILAGQPPAPSNRP
jgi:DNA topoisomerase IB